MKPRPKISLYEPDIPQNTAAIIRTCACLGAELEIIEPCGFLLTDKRFKRVVMDYMDYSKIKFYQSAEHFFEEKTKQKIFLKVGRYGRYLETLLDDGKAKRTSIPKKMKNEEIVKIREQLKEYKNFELWSFAETL